MLKHLSRTLANGRRRRQASKTLSLRGAEIELVVPVIESAGIGPRKRQPDIRPALEQSPVSQPLAADLIVVYAIDGASRLEYISNQAAAASGFTTEELHDRAVKNLPARLSNVRLRDAGEGVLQLSAGGTLEASLLLLDDLWLQLADYLPGDPLAAVPSRDRLFIIGSERPNADELISKKARTEALQKRHAISQCVLVRREGKWVAHRNGPSSRLSTA